MEITTAVTPFIVECAADHPTVWALELLPAYDAVARMKVRAHWQTDVLASFAIGTAIGLYSSSRSMPFTLEDAFLGRQPLQSARSAAEPSISAVMYR